MRVEPDGGRACEKILAPLSTSASSIRWTTASLLTTVYCLNRVLDRCAPSRHMLRQDPASPTGHRSTVIPQDYWDHQTSSNQSHINQDRPTRPDDSLPGLR